MGILVLKREQLFKTDLSRNFKSLKHKKSLSVYEHILKTPNGYRIYKSILKDVFKVGNTTLEKIFSDLQLAHLIAIVDDQLIIKYSNYVTSNVSYSQSDTTRRESLKPLNKDV